MSILFISHDLSLVKKLADRVLVMNNGKIVIIDLGINNKASIIMDDILDLSAVGSDYNVYNISSIDK